MRIQAFLTAAAINLKRLVTALLLLLWRLSPLNAARIIIMRPAVSVVTSNSAKMIAT